MIARNALWQLAAPKFDVEPGNMDDSRRNAVAAIIRITDGEATPAEKKAFSKVRRMVTEEETSRYIEDMRKNLHWFDGWTIEKNGGRNPYRGCHKGGRRQEVAAERLCRFRYSRPVDEAGRLLYGEDKKRCKQRDDEDFRKLLEGTQAVFC